MKKISLFLLILLTTNISFYESSASAIVETVKDDVSDIKNFIIANWHVIMPVIGGTRLTYAIYKILLKSYLKKYTSLSQEYINKDLTESEFNETIKLINKLKGDSIKYTGDKLTETSKENLANLTNRLSEIWNKKFESKKITIKTEDIFQDIVNDPNFKKIQNKLGLSDDDIHDVLEENMLEQPEIEIPISKPSIESLAQEISQEYAKKVETQHISTLDPKVVDQLKEFDKPVQIGNKEYTRISDLDVEVVDLYEEIPY